MGDASDKTLKLKIELDGYVMPGTEKVRSELADSTKKLASETADLSDETKKASSAAEEHNTHLQGGRMIFGALDRIVPHLGHALHAAFSGPLGPVILLGMAIAEVYKKIGEVNKALEDLNAAEFADHKAAIDEVWKAWDTCRQEVLKYQTAVKEAGQDKDPAASHLKRIKEISAAQTEAASKEIEELGKVQVAWLKAHGASPEQIAAAQENTAASAENLRATSAQQNLADIRKDIAGRTERQSDFDATQAAEANRVARADNKIGALTKEKGKVSSDEDAKKLDDLITQKSAALERLNEALENEDEGTLPFSMDTDTKNRVQSELDTALKKKALIEKRLAQLEEEIAAAEQEKIAAQAALSRVSAAGIANRGAIRGETEAVQTGTVVEGIKESSAKNLQAIKAFGDAVELIKGKDLNAIIAGGATAQDDLKNLREQGFSDKKIKADYLLAERHRATPGEFSQQDAEAESRYQRFEQDKAGITDLNLLLTTLGANSAAMVKIISDHQKGSISLTTEIQRLQATNDSLQNQINALGSQNFHARNNPGG